MEGLAQSGWAEREALEAARGLLFDWDGCVAVNNRILPSAARLIARHLERVAVITNNSTHLREDFVRILERNGLEIPEERIFTAGIEALHRVRDSGCTRVLMLSSTAMRRHALDLGIPLVREEPDLVLLMRDPRFTYAKLERAANALRDGARLVVANADRAHPGVGGRLVPETGALLAALLSCAGEYAPAPEMIGKPGPILFDRACKHLGIGPAEAVMIGDNPETDGEGALQFGIRPILIGGNSRLRMDDLLEPLAAE
ncbi:hydrolase, haloacid dehydrogenase (HAD) family protein [Erythrobacter sp. SG61-1L]|nr:hydrolase, haloacid dehydrogenase (HAD) family protein [Erythrobacter sp. SG61-1L]